MARPGRPPRVYCRGARVVRPGSARRQRRVEPGPARPESNPGARLDVGPGTRRAWRRLLAQAWLKSHDANKLTEATALFKQSLALADDPEVECDLGLALFYLGQPARAQARMTRCLPRLAAANPDRVVRYRKVEPEIAAAVARDHAPIDIVTTPPDAVIPSTQLPRGRDLDCADPRVVAGRAPHPARPARRPRRRHLVDRGHRGRRPRPGPAGRGATLRPAATPTSAARPRRSRTPAYVTLGAAGALLAGGALVDVLGRDVRSEMATLSGDAYDDKLDTWHLYQRSTIGLWTPPGRSRPASAPGCGSARDRCR